MERDPVSLDPYEAHTQGFTVGVLQPVLSETRSHFHQCFSEWRQASGPAGRLSVGREGI